MKFFFHEVYLEAKVRHDEDQKAEV